MQIHLPGTAAGGGVPQWNCTCLVCAEARAGSHRVRPRTQSSVTISADGRSWFLLNASPDMRAQIESFPPLHPSAGGGLFKSSARAEFVGNTERSEDMSRPVFRPFSLLAEITHRCPLHCPYCSNPLRLASMANELTTSDWKRVLNEASELGVLHVAFSGGEPLQRPDLAESAAAAREAGLYSNLITSSLGLSNQRLDELKRAGLDSIQISFQSDEESLADRIAGTAAHARKLQAAQMVRDAGMPLTINTVLHRANIGRLEQIISLAERLGAERLELANTQYYGWAFKNRAALLPTRAQIERAVPIASAAKSRLLGKMEVLFVVPDYYSDRPKPCMNGWGQKHLTVNPIGEVLPCPTAHEIKSLRFDTGREKSLAWIWNESEAFNRFRGTEWLPEPCHDCEFREVDFGGCRCQAALITGDAAVTDPACQFSPQRKMLTDFVGETQGGSDISLDENELVFRQNRGI